MSVITSRRSFIGGLAILIASPAIVRASNIMPVRNMVIVPKFTDAQIAADIEGFFNAPDLSTLEMVRKRIFIAASESPRAALMKSFIEGN